MAAKWLIDSFFHILDEVLVIARLRYSQTLSAMVLRRNLNLNLHVPVKGGYGQGQRFQTRHTYIGTLELD